MEKTEPHELLEVESEGKERLTGSPEKPDRKGLWNVVCWIIVFGFLFVTFLLLLSVTVVIGSLLGVLATPSRSADVVKIGILTPGYQYDKYFAGLMKNAALRAQERLEEMFGADSERLDIEFVLCTECTYDEADLVVQVQGLYDDGVKVFVGPLTSSQTETLAVWSAENAQDTLFVSPSATADVLSTYGNVIRMIMSNYVRASAYASKFSEFRGEMNFTASDCGEFSSTRVFSIWKNDTSSRDFYQLMDESATNHMLLMEPPVVYAKNAIEEKADALTHVQALANLVSGSQPNSSVIFVQAHTEITYILEALDDYPVLLDYNWFIVGMAFNQDLLLSEASVRNAARVKLSSLLYTGNGYTYLDEKRQLIDDLNEDLNVTSDVGIVNPLALSVYDTVLLVYDAIRMHGPNGVLKENILKEAVHEFGMTGHLKMNEEFDFRVSGQYSFVTVSNISSNVGWIVMSEIFSAPLVDHTSTNDNVNVSVEYVINEKNLGGVHLDKDLFSSFCTADWIVIEGVDKYGNFKSATIDSTTSDLSSIKAYGVALGLKNEKTYVKMKCAGGDGFPLSDYYLWVVCPFSYSGNLPDCSFVFFDENYVEMKSFQYVLTTFSLRDAIYESDIMKWLKHGFGFLTNDYRDDLLESNGNSKLAVDSVFCKMNQFLQN